MESNRILYSDNHAHDLRLTEQDMGVIQHALTVLEIAFNLEPQYRACINQALRKVSAGFSESPAIEL